MKKIANLLLLLLLGLSSFGCRNHVEVDGERYAMLTDDETRLLMAFARETLLRNSDKLIPPDEVAAVRRTEPELNIEYRGDCSGEAVVIWDLPKRKYEVVIDGMFNETSPFKRDVMVRIMKKHGPVLDLRDSQRKQKVQTPRP